MDGSNTCGRGFILETGNRRCFQSESQARGSAMTRGLMSSGTICSATTACGRECSCFGRERKN